MRQNSISFQSHKADLLLINEISKPSRIAQLQAPSNMHELNNLLRFKNSKSSRSKQQKQTAQVWLNNVGIDVSPLMQRVQKAKQISVQKSELKKIEEDCLFYIPDMSYKKIDEYLLKAHDYASMNIVQKNMKKSNQSNIIMNRIQNKFAQVSNKSKQVGEQRTLGLITSIKVQTRDQQKREKYISCISAMANKNIHRHQLVHQISNTLNKKLWKIFSRHVRCLSDNKAFSDEQKLTYLCLQSLKMVQDEYDSYLARGSQSLNYYLSSNYIEKLQKRQQRYIRDRQHQSFWGKAFILYRAGRKKDFYTLLSTRNQIQLMNQFKKVDQSIDKKRPEKMNSEHVRSEQNDVFKEQLMFALTGEPKYSSEILSDPYTLDFVWILIRNLGVFYTQSGVQFENYKGKFLQTYSKQSFLTDQQLYNYLYLVSYEQIAEMGLSDIMDQDDYVHFLICLYENLDLCGNKNETIKKLLSKQLIIYIRQLISLGRSEYVYYMALIPQGNRLTEISSLLSSSNLVSSFNWDYLRSSIPNKNQFEEIVKRTLEKYILTTNDCISAAQKYVQLLHYNEQAIKCLLQYLIKNFYNNSYTTQSVYQAENACERYLYKNTALEQKFKDVLNFIVDCRKILELLKDRKDNQIYRFVKNSDFIMIGTAIPAKNHKFLQNLMQTSWIGMDVYFKFLKHVIKGLQIFYLKQNKNQQLRQFIGLLQENIDLIFSFQKYKPFIGRDEAKSLLQLISSTNYAVSKY